MRLLFVYIATLTVLLAGTASFANNSKEKKNKHPKMSVSSKKVKTVKTQPKQYVVTPDPDYDSTLAEKCYFYRYGWCAQKK